MRPPLRGQRICTKTQGGRNLGNLACAYGLMRKIKVNGSGQECPLHDFKGRGRGRPLLHNIGHTPQLVGSA